MAVNMNKKRKNEGIVAGDSLVPAKKEKREFKNTQQGKSENGQRKNVWNASDKQSKGKPGGDGKAPKKKKNIANKQQREVKKKELTTIVTEAKANYQLFSDKALGKEEKQMLVTKTYDLVKDNIPELARIKGMGKVISSLIDVKNKKQILYITNLYSSAESKLLLMKGNGYKLAIKLIQIGSPTTVRQFADACLTNGKGLRGLMANFQSARSLCAIYAAGNAEVKRTILRKLVLGNMALTTSESSPLSEVFASCKQDVIEGCKTFLQSILNEKTVRHDVVQDILTLCLQSQKLNKEDVETLVTFGAENILHLCRRATNSALPLWVIWLSSAQARKRIMKTLKGKVASLLQTYNGRMFLMALIESTDDTKALDKFVLNELIESLDDLVQQVEARKLLEFILVPRSTKFMHPKEIEFLKQGDIVKTSKKSDETRFNEIRDYLQEPILQALKKNSENWLKDNKLCLFVIAIIETYGAAFDLNLLQKFSKTFVSSEYSDRIAEKAVRMVIESLCTADISRYEVDEDAALFVNTFIPDLQPQARSFVSKCQRPASLLFDVASKVQKKLDFKLKKSWISSTDTQSQIAEWKKNKPVFEKK